MKTISSVFKQRNWVSLSLGIIILSVLSACGSDSTPTPDADPTGYYDVTGTATVKMDDNTTDLNISDFQAMVNDNRFIAMSVAEGLVYDGDITSINGNDYTASISIYRDGAVLTTATVNGMITEGSSMTGTLTGTGAGNGSFSLTYATSNNEVAALSRVENLTNWTGPIGGSTTDFGFDINSSGIIVTDSRVRDGVFISCNTDGPITPISGGNLYSVSVTLSTCDPSAPNGDYTGLATTRNADNTLVYVVTNGAYSLDGEFAR